MLFPFLISQQVEAITSNLNWGSLVSEADLLISFFQSLSLGCCKSNSFSVHSFW